MENLYEILGIDRNATQAEIKAAYRKLAAQYHPDRNQTIEAEETFKQINLAHEVLSDFYCRLQYEKEYDAYHGHSTQTDIGDEQESTDQQAANSSTTEPTSEQNPIFTWKWKLALLATPFIILIGIGILKFIFTFGNSSEAKAETIAVNAKPDAIRKTETPLVQKSTTGSKKITIWELRRMAVAQPDQCLQYLDTMQAAILSAKDLKEIRSKALQQLPVKTAYFFEINECERAQQSFQLLLVNQIAITPHTRKKLDFYRFRCAMEAEGFPEAMAILDEMQDRYQHHYSILAAKSQVLHVGMKKIKASLIAYEQARLLYKSQQIDAQFVKFWKPDYQSFSYGNLLAMEALALHELGEDVQSKKVAIQAIHADSTQVLAYELIGNQFKKEDNKWGACKYWRKALENGSTKVTNDLLKYCE